MTDHLHHLAGAYALDALDDDERRAFEAHYPTCEICAQEVAEFQETAAVLAEAEAAPVPDGLERSVLDAIGETRQVSPLVPDAVVDLAERRRRRVNRPILLAAVAAAIVFVAGFAVRSRPSDVDRLIAAPDAIVTELAGAQGSVEVVWSAERDQVLVTTSGLQTLESNLAYQLWFINDDGVSPAPTFTIDRNGDAAALLNVANLDPQGWGITIEPKSGSLQPTSEVLYAGTI